METLGGLFMGDGLEKNVIFNDICELDITNWKEIKEKNRLNHLMAKFDRLLYD